MIKQNQNNDKKEKLEKALRENLHRRKASSNNNKNQKEVSHKGEEN